MTENPQLRQACEAWLKAALGVLADQPIDEELDFEIEFSSGSWTGHSIMRPDYDWFVSRHHQVFMSLGETEEVLRIVRGDPTIGKTLLVDGGGTRRPQSEEKMWLLGQYLNKLASVYLDRFNQARFVLDWFYQLYEQLEQYIYRFESIVVIWLVQFRNVKIEQDVVNLELGVRLRPASDDERSQAVKGDEGGLLLSRPRARFQTIGNPGYLMQMPDRHQVPDVFLEIEGRKAAPIEGIDYSQASRHGRRLLTALRLLGPNPIGTHSIWFLNKNPFQYGGSGPRQHLGEALPWVFPEEPYVVTPDVGAQLQTLWPKLAQEPEDQRLALALRRLEESYSRGRPEDKLIDYWIALEALFLPDDRQELSYRIALRLARYLGASQEERLRLFEEMKESYGLRSKVVHGQIMKENNKLSQVVDRTGNSLRDVLRRSINGGIAPSPSDIHRMLLA